MALAYTVLREWVFDWRGVIVMGAREIGR